MMQRLLWMAQISESEKLKFIELIPMPDFFLLSSSSAGRFESEILQGLLNALRCHLIMINGDARWTLIALL